MRPRFHPSMFWLCTADSGSVGLDAVLHSISVVLQWGTPEVNAWPWFLAKFLTRHNWFNVELILAEILCCPPLFTDPRRCCKPTAFLKVVFGRWTWKKSGPISLSLTYNQEILARSTNDFSEIRKKQEWDQDSGLLSIASSSLIPVFYVLFYCCWKNNSVRVLVGYFQYFSRQWLHAWEAFRSHS